MNEQPEQRLVRIPRLRDLTDCRGVSLLPQIEALPKSTTAPLDLDAEALIYEVDLLPDANLSHPFAIGIRQPGYGPQYFIWGLPVQDE